MVEHGNPEKAFEILMEEYEVDEQTLREDISILVTGFLESGLMHEQSV